MRRWQLKHRQRNVAQLLIHWNPGVVQRRCLENDPASSTDTSQRENPQEETIQDHRNELPVFHHLKVSKQLESSRNPVSTDCSCSLPTLTTHCDVWASSAVSLVAMKQAGRVGGASQCDWRLPRCLCLHREYAAL